MDRCDGCGELLPDETASLWFDTPLGLTATGTHRTQPCARASVSKREAEGWKFRRNGPPMSTSERLKREHG